MTHRLDHRLIAPARPRMMQRLSRPILGRAISAAALLTIVACAPADPAAHERFDRLDRQTAWREVPVWDEGPAEWAVYESTRVIYGRPRSFTTTIFTNTQHMDPATTTKAEDWRDPDTVAVFKHTVSQMIPTENYDYRLLATAFLHRQTLAPFKFAASTQEDCGMSYREFNAQGGVIEAVQHCYFPGTGRSEARFDADAPVMFHDALSLVLRDYPFDAEEQPEWRIMLIPPQLENRETDLEPAPAVVRYIGRETVDVPMGSVEAHHLRVEHAPVGGDRESNYWFAADAEMRHVMVRHHGPFGVELTLKRLDWWAYWDQPRPE